MGISIIVVPAIIESSTDPLHTMLIWRGMYERGKGSNPKIAAATLLSYAFAAYDARSRGLPWVGYLGAGLFTLAIVPFTLILMTPTNNKLLQSAAAQEKELLMQPTTQLVETWSQMNFARGCLPLAGAFLGLWALLG
jgi:Domain of unknown function (DUF1772)